MAEQLLYSVAACSKGTPQIVLSLDNSEKTTVERAVQAVGVGEISIQNQP